MSFASGYNAGMNLTAQLRADSRARRQEERQMVLDEKAEERARVKDEIDNLQIMSLKTKMETEKAIRERIDLQRAESRIALGKFVEESRKLNPDDLDGYADIYAKYRPLVTDPEVAKSFQNVYSVHEIFPERLLGSCSKLQGPSRHLGFYEERDRGERERSTSCGHEEVWLKRRS